MKYYKILENKRSCHGGDQEYEVGKWYEIKDKERISLCKYGYHVTTEPYSWYMWDCECYEAEIGKVYGRDDNESVTNRIKLTKKVRHPDWWIGAHKFVDEDLKNIEWFSQKGRKLKEWRYFKRDNFVQAWKAVEEATWEIVMKPRLVRDEARCVAWRAERQATWKAAREAVKETARMETRQDTWKAAQQITREARQSAELYVICKYICQGLNLDKKYLRHAEDRMEVWKRGYGLHCDINGELYVYGTK